MSLCTLNANVFTYVNINKEHKSRVLLFYLLKYTTWSKIKPRSYDFNLILRVGNRNSSREPFGVSTSLLQVYDIFQSSRLFKNQINTPSAFSDYNVTNDNYNVSLQMNENNGSMNEVWLNDWMIKKCLWVSFFIKVHRTKIASIFFLFKMNQINAFG